jgi:hypothetical protein
MEDSSPSSEELESQVVEVLGGQVTELHVKKIDVAGIAGELESGQATIPFAGPDSLRSLTFESQSADLRPDSVDTGFLREGPDTQEEVSLPPEQSYLLGIPDTPSRLGGLTILDDNQTMLQGLAHQSDFGISYIEPVNQVLGTDKYPDYHVFYNIANTKDFEIGSDDVASTDAKSASSSGSKPMANNTTGAVLDGDAQFYNRDPSTVWHRQESLFLVTQLTNGLIEPASSNTWQLTLKITGQEVWVQNGPSPDDPDKLMDQLTDPNYLLLNSLASDEIHLFLEGDDLNRLGGLAAGIGTPDGGWGGGNGKNHAMSEVLPRYSFHINAGLLAHETGHLLGGHHGKALKSGCSGSMCGRSLMNHVITPNTEHFYSDQNDQDIKEVVDAVLP